MREIGSDIDDRPAPSRRRVTAGSPARNRAFQRARTSTPFGGLQYLVTVRGLDRLAAEVDKLFAPCRFRHAAALDILDLEDGPREYRRRAKRGEAAELGDPDAAQFPERSGRRFGRHMIVRGAGRGARADHQNPAGADKARERRGPSIVPQRKVRHKGDLDPRQVVAGRGEAASNISQIAVMMKRQGQLGEARKTKREGGLRDLVGPVGAENRDVDIDARPSTSSRTALSSEIVCLSSA